MRTLTILGLVLLISGISFAQEEVIGREFPEELALGFYDNWVEIEDRSLDYFPYLAEDENDMERILRDELTENDRPLRQVNYANPADEKERLTLIYGNNPFPYILFLQQILEDRTDHDSFMYIMKHTKNRMRLEGWKKMPESFYPAVVSSKERAERFHEELGRYIVFMHRNRDADFLNSGGLIGWIRFGPTVSYNQAIAKDAEKARATPPEKRTEDMFKAPWYFLIARFNHPTGGVEAFFLICEKNDDDSFTELYMIHAPNYKDDEITTSFKNSFYKSVKDGKWYLIPKEEIPTLTFYLADESRLGKFILFRGSPQ